jgi:antibiotic biosynthesis monooxygenase (ABM) superfamily enzyme
MKSFFETAINAIITAGYLVTLIFGMGFAYFGHTWAFHGLYIFGLSLMFLPAPLMSTGLLIYLLLPSTRRMLEAWNAKA